ncbi:DUF4097 family beta strand repeat-containing protein [Streptosporangium sp. G11]|uniref:DUF4097 family beta strand repeat-containing protein n=1 Tax=Streptosporangium sp. G11 TaxID=3436926 RepID=UPI003EC11DD6
MPTFDTPEPISATIVIATGNVRITASDRTDTVVEIRPSDKLNDADVRAAEQIRVEYSGGRLLVKAPGDKTRSWLDRDGSVEVTLDLPTDSRVDANTSADLRCEGRLGESKFTTAAGDIWLDQTDKLQLTTASGDVTVARSVGHTDVTTADGGIRIGEIYGTAVIRTTNGDIALGEATGDLRLNTAYGDITVDRALASIGAKSAHGSVRIGEVVRGSVALETASGELEVGIREGTAAWLDVQTRYGTVSNSLDACEGPEQSDEAAKVRAHTEYGDIVIRRSRPLSTG